MQPDTAPRHATTVPGLTALSEGFLRLSLSLPFPPSAVNVWWLRNADGWTVIDCGVDNAATRAAFEQVFADPLLEGRPVTEVLVTHFHPDHIGLAGWLCARTGAPLAMTHIEWLQARVLLHEPEEEALRQLVTQAGRCGAPEAFLAFLGRRGTLYPKWVGPLPPSYHRIRSSDLLNLAGSRWQVMIGEGHAPEMICLYSAERRMLIAADQILGRITPHIGAQASDPKADPLGAFLATLTPFEALPEDTLVLPSHGEPFHGLHARVATLRAHHAEHLDRLVDFCTEPRTVMDATQVLFRALALEQIGFGLSEALAHLRHLEALGALARQMETPSVSTDLGLGRAPADCGRWLFTRT
ncbi:MBL fold metallo-hydrolase [Xanthobacter sp.]|uniref:MBL fold metallo-hydrolase n=1 Tax=Xanthobacter sp. TaxID=35809 RepID=UPI0025DA9686|nr:MBL fold metallo-hydrolase [Xanthobacter sp.]